MYERTCHIGIFLHTKETYILTSDKIQHREIIHPSCWLHHKAGWLQFHSLISIASSLLDSSSIQESIPAFTNHILQAAKVTIPLGPINQVKSNGGHKTFIYFTIKSPSKMYRSDQSFKSEGDLIKYKQARAKLVCRKHQ